MNNHKSFAEIFQDKLKKQEAKAFGNDEKHPPFFATENSTTADWMQHYLFENSFSNPLKNQGGANKTNCFYFRQPRKTQASKGFQDDALIFKSEVKSQPTPPPHQLSDEQKKSKSYFANAKENLNPAFQRHELKSAFRRLAKKLHPDHGGTDADYRQLLAHYQNLKIIF